MSADALDTLLDRLAVGEVEAAEEVQRIMEPVLRTMVRRRLSPKLRAKFDSMDVVQSVWADVFRAVRVSGLKFHDRDHLRAHLARLTYNHFVNSCRQNSRAIEHEQPFQGDEPPGLAASPQPRPSQVAQAGELWETLLGLCPPAHRELLLLKREGFPLAEIAARTGLHESSVRRILYELARKLAARRGGPEAEPGLSG